MNKKQTFQEQLKPLEQIFEPDERQKAFSRTLQDRHESLSQIILNDNVPLNVKELFETAKNLSLYSWFVYRFHQAAELISFSALEMALRERYLGENPPQNNSNKRPPSLGKLMQHAKNQGWIINENFPGIYNRAKRLAEDRKNTEKIKSHDFEKQPLMLHEEANEREIATAMADIDVVGAMSNNTHHIRNDLAHGSSTLHPDSDATLRKHAEVINQIYPSHI